MNLLAYIPLVLLIVLLAVLLQRRSFQGFPWFFAYVLFGVLAGVARFIVRNNAPVYFQVYWGTEIGYSILGVAVLYEVFRAVFGNLLHRWWMRALFPGVVVLTAAVIVIRVHNSPIQYNNWVGTWIVNGELGVRFLQVAMFVILACLVPLIGLRWRQHPFGITAGFGLYATVALIATRRISVFGTKSAFLLGVTSLVAYSMAVLIWIWFFCAGEKPEPPHPEEPPLSLEQLERYREFIQRRPKQ